MAAAYQEDLAYIHDVGFGEFARQSAPGLLQMLGDGRPVRGRLVVDLGCGSGIWARELARAGFDVLGIDQSRAMIALSRERLPGGQFRVGSFVDVELPRCAAVTALGEVLNYRFDERNSVAALKRLFRRVHRALDPGGLFIFDVADIERNSGDTQRFTHGKDWVVLVAYEHDAKRGRLTRRITSFRKVGKRYRRSDEVHRLQLYRPGELTAALREVGFRVRPLRSYGEYRFAKGVVAFAARK